MSARRLGRVRIAGAILREALGLPPDVEIYSAHVSMTRDDELVLLVGHAQLAPVAPGGLIPEAVPVMGLNPDKPRPGWEFVTWELSRVH